MGRGKEIAAAVFTIAFTASCASGSTGSQTPENRNVPAQPGRTEAPKTNLEPEAKASALRLTQAFISLNEQGVKNEYSPSRRTEFYQGSVSQVLLTNYLNWFRTQCRTSVDTRKDIEVSNNTNLGLGFQIRVPFATQCRTSLGNPALGMHVNLEVVNGKPYVMNYATYP